MINNKKVLVLILVSTIIVGLFKISPIKVEASSAIESVQIIQAPYEYTAGEVFDRSKVVVQVNYVTGLSEIVTNYNTPDIDKYIPMYLKKLRVEYSGVYTTKSIFVNEPTTDVGVDDFGNSVDLSLWKYTKKKPYTNATSYVLGDLPGPHYIGPIVDGAIVGNIPAYINGLPVYNISYAFLGLQDLTVIPSIPKTVKVMNSTFKDTNVTGTLVLPDNLVNTTNLFSGVGNPVSVKYKYDIQGGLREAGPNIVEEPDYIKSIRILNLDKLKIGVHIGTVLDLEVEYVSGEKRIISEVEEGNYLSFDVDGVNFSGYLKSDVLGNVLTATYRGIYTTSVVINEIDVFGIEVGEVYQKPFKAGATVEKSDLLVRDIVYGNKIESFNIVYPTKELTVDDNYIEVEFLGYSVKANITVEEETPTQTLGQVIVSYINKSNMEDIKTQDIYEYPVDEEVTINAPEINGYKIALGYNSSETLIPNRDIPQYLTFTYETYTPSQNNVIVNYIEFGTDVILNTVEKNYDTVETYITEYPEDIPTGYKLSSWEETSKEFYLYADNQATITFYINKLQGFVTIEKWVDNSWMYWNTLITLPTGVHSINANDYFTSMDYILVGDSNKIVEVLDGESTTVRFDYQTPPQGFINIKINFEDGSTFQSFNTQKPIGKQIININEYWNDNLYEVLGTNEKVVEVNKEQTVIVEFTIRKKATGFVNKIAKYGGEVLRQEKVEYPIGVQEIYAPMFSNLYEVDNLDTIKQVEVLEGQTVDVVFNYNKRPTYFVNHIGKHGEVVLFNTTQEKLMSDTWVYEYDGFRDIGTFNKDIYLLQGNYMLEVIPIENEVVNVVWNYTKVDTGWVKIIGYDKDMKVIHTETKEVRAENTTIRAPYIVLENKDLFYKPDNIKKPITPGKDESSAFLVEFYFELINTKDPKEDPKAPEKPDNSESSITDILLTVEPTNFRATIPFKIDIYMDKMGVITIGEGYQIINECPLGQIVLVDIEVTPVEGWSLVSISDNFKTKKINTKEFGLSVNGSIALNNKVPLNTLLSEPIRNGESKDLVFDTKLAGQTGEVNQVISQLSIVLDFWK